MNIITLTRQTLLENIEELVEVDRVIKIDKNWRYENFLAELSGKWNNSYIALRENTIAGFIICSIKDETTLHIHRLAIRREFQNMGIGTKLVTHVINSTNSKINRLTLKVKADNIMAQSFYNRLGFEYKRLEDQKYIYQRLL